jgi:hypothetical protein
MKEIAILKTLNAEYRLKTEELIGPLVAEWNELLQDHEVWSKSKRARTELSKKSISDLKRLGFDCDEPALRKFANAGLVEIELQMTDDCPAWQLPWEYLLTSATERFQSKSQMLLVLRRLNRSLKTTFVARPSKLLICKNNPEYLANLYTDKSLRYEETNVAENIGLESDVDAHNLTLEELGSLVANYCPDVVHVVGVDSWQATTFKYSGQEAVSVRTIPEGMMVKGVDDAAEIASPSRLVTALCSCGNHLPRMFAFNFNRSASFAALAVSRGAHAAFGFYSTIDDLVAESFYTNFYLAWRLSDWNLLDAFRLSWTELAAETTTEKLCGSGIVLWVSESLLERERSKRSESGAYTSPSQPSAALRGKFAEEATKTLEPQPITKAIDVRIKELDDINYCLLHNNRNLFHWFYIRKLLPEGILRNVLTEVSLYVGAERLIFRARKDLRYPIWNLVDSVRIPLTAALPRALRESVYTGLHVKVSASEIPVYENTFRVNLLPIDQWQNDDRNRKWLPSFVLPRDPIVIQIVDVAQKYLAAIADDPSAGFNGYQDTASPEAADVQARAMWCALWNDFSLSYVNPPPSFKDKAQRLRSPSDVIKGRRGTCIDLALLFAAALEYVEIYPVVLLFADHAIAGFYRTQQAHEKIREYMVRNSSSDEDFWMLGRAVLPTIKEMIESKQLVAIETVGLTRRTAFLQAIIEGTKRVQESLDFEFLVDVHLARESGVTPLPI